MKGKLLFFLLLFFIGAAAQNTSRPVNNQLVEDWLVKPVSSKAEVIYNESKKEIIFSNGLFNRKFRIFPNVVCVDYKNKITGQQLLRAVSPEAKIAINGKEYNVGGLYGQKEKAYLLPEWLDGFTKNDSDFIFDKYEVINTQPFINWVPGKWWATNKQYPGGKKNEIPDFGYCLARPF